MRQMLFAIRGTQQRVYATRPAELLDMLLPALTDDPEEPWELETAMQRLRPPQQPPESFHQWTTGDPRALTETEFCLIDLRSRLLVVDCPEPESLRCGQVRYGGLDDQSACWLPYRLSREWSLCQPRDDWHRCSQSRESRGVPLDERDILMTRVLPFVIAECLAARGGATDDEFRWTPPRGWQWRVLPARGASGHTTVADAVAEIHARWLMTAQAELGGRSPRAVLLARREAIDMSIEDREYQWKLCGIRPQPLNILSMAYRCGGFGTHEVIVYYHLVRYLTNYCWDIVTEAPGTPEAEVGAGNGVLEVTRERWQGQTLERVFEAIRILLSARDNWLREPNHELFSGLIPEEIVHWERQRMPLAVSRCGAVGHCLCPQAPESHDRSPVFWYLDDYGIDEDEPFTLS